MHYSTTLKEKLISTEVCVDNEYLDLYVKLVANNSDRQHEIYRTQTHHIIPKFVYQLRNEEIDNSERNLVVLVYCDHVLAHFYLAMCASSKRLRDGNLCAVNAVIRGFNPESDERKLIEELPEIQRFYEEAKHINCLKDDTPEKISQALKGNVFIYNEKTQQYKCVDKSKLNSYISSGWIRKHPPQTEEAKRKISALHRGLKSIHKEGVVKQVSESEIEKFINDGWTRGRGYGTTGTTGRIAITDGYKTKYVCESDIDAYISVGWHKGTAKKGKPCYTTRGVKFSSVHKEHLAATRRGKIGMLDTTGKQRYVDPIDVSFHLNNGWTLGGLKGRKGTTTGKRWINKNGKTKYIFESELPQYMEEEWKIGRG